MRDGSTVTLYVGEQVEATGTLSGGLPSEAAQVLTVGAINTPANYANLQATHLVIVNRVLAEYETYWGIGWPTDDIAETDVLGNWPFIERAGTTVKDYSSFAKDLTISGATWNGALCGSARGLGVFTHRRRDGTLYHAIACGRRGTSSAGSDPSGAVYIWKASRAFTPFSIGGDPGNDDATATLDGLNFYARMQFLSCANDLLIANGRDIARCYGGATAAISYWGITAPATGPVVTMAGSGGSLSAGSYDYCYTYFNSNTGVESGRSPVTTKTAAANDAATVDCFGSLDVQVTHLRVYRSVIVGGTTFVLIGEIANGTAPTWADSVADTSIVNNIQLDGGTASGNGIVKRLFNPGGPTTGLTADLERPQKNPSKPSPPTLPTAGAPSGGGSIDNGKHYWAYSWYSSTTGDETGLSPPSAPQTAGGGNQTVALSAMVLPDKSLTLYDKIRIYRTKANARVWYLLATITAAATYSDTTADSSLTTDLSTYSLPPKCRFAIVFGNRLFIAGDPLKPSSFYWSAPGDYQNFPLTNEHIANPGAEITGLASTQGVLWIHYNDGRIFGLPQPGYDPDIRLFVIVNTVERYHTGATIGHYTFQNTPQGLVWLARDGFYIMGRQFTGNADPNTPVPYATTFDLLSPTLTPTFLNLNRVRCRYAASLYLADQKIYLCWVSRGNNRLNEEAFCCEFTENGPKWNVWDCSADAAGVLTDANEQPHYCFLSENGVLQTFNITSSKDGDGTGTLSGAVAGAQAGSFTAIAGRTAPTGGDGGYGIYLKKSDGTIVRRIKRDPAMDPRGNVDGLDFFYPSYVGVKTGSWTAYFSGIRLLWTTMKSWFGDLRFDKTFESLYISHALGTGTLGVKSGTNDATLAAFTSGGTANLADNMTSQVAFAGAASAAGRTLQLEISHDPPAAGQPVKIVQIEVEGSLGGDTP